MASREATINVNIADLPQVKEMLEAATAEIERLQAIVDDAPNVIEPPRWGRHHATHMKGWEAFGVVPGSDPTVRRLGIYAGGGTPGTEKWGPGEVKLGVAGIEFITSADHPAGCYLYVIGTEEADVERRWHLAADLWNEMGARLWPTTR